LERVTAARSSCSRVPRRRSLSRRTNSRTYSLGVTKGSLGQPPRIDNSVRIKPFPRDRFRNRIMPNTRLAIHSMTTVLLTALAFGQQVTPTPGSSKAPPTPQRVGPIEIVTDTRGIDFRPYLQNTLRVIKKNWYQVVPSSALPPIRKRGTVVLEFAIQKDGTITALRYASSSQDVALDRAAYFGVKTSSPLAPLPALFSGSYLGIRIKFLYNPPPGENEVLDSGQPSSGDVSQVEAVRLSEILVANKPAAPGEDALNQSLSARGKALKLLAEIRAGQSFDFVATTRSDDPSSAIGGDIGYFERGKLAKSIEDVVFAMNPGDVSDVIQTKQGFVILKVTEHRGSPPRTDSKSNTN
jgi:TonB family protein